MKMKSFDEEAVCREIQNLKWAQSPLLRDYKDYLLIKHEGLGTFGTHKGRSAAWIWEKRLAMHGLPRLVAERSSGSWALAISRIGAVCGVNCTFVTVSEPDPKVRITVEANNGKFVVVKTNAERRSALQSLLDKGAWCPDQHNNPKVITAFRETLGKETAADLKRAGVLQDQLRFVVAAMGTGGSAAGLALGLRDAGYNKFEVIGCDSTTSIVGGWVTSAPPFGLTVPGVGSADEVCRTFREARKLLLRPLIRVSPLLAAEAAAEFMRFNPRGCGMSSGLALSACENLLVHELRRDEKILVLFPDDATRYGNQISFGSL